ncbi:MAG: hypothetical protein FGF48_04175 [Candidatus Brockarchaeota archaeon]|nr:hypothetical protein [Candidatus Brockarchaeota archaeon]
MSSQSTRLLLASAFALFLLNQAGLNRVCAQVQDAADRGVLGDVLDAAGLHALVENLYFFRDAAVSGGGLDAEFLRWLTPSYAGLSRSLTSIPGWSFLRFLLLPAAIAVSTCFSLYIQIGLVGAVLTASLLIGLIYAFPIFLVLEAFSKTGLVAVHSRRMLAVLILLMVASMLTLLFAYAYRNIPMIFYSFAVLFFTACFAWFLPILLYYWG